MYHKFNTQLKYFTWLRVAISLRFASTILLALWALDSSLLQPKVHAQVLPIEPGSWTLAVLPDTQVYAEFHPQIFTGQTQFLVDHAESLNIKCMLHEGDVTEHNNFVQWTRSLNSLSLLDGVVPYAVAPGNHDYGPGGNAANRDSMFNDPAFFGPGTAYANQPTVGGFFEPGKTDNSYHTFSAGGNDWLVLALEWAPRDEVVDWASQVTANHPDHLAMLVTHAYMYYDNTRYDWESKGTAQSWSPHTYPVAQLPGETVNDGEQLWNKLVSQHENFRLVFSGHTLGDGTGFLSSEGIHGNVVHQMLANYQFKAQGGFGDMRLLEFLPDGETVAVRTYSPTLDRYDTAFDQQFSFNLNQKRDAPAPPINYAAVAANLLMHGETAPVANTVDGVTIAQTSAPGVTTLQINRGDFQIAVGGVGTRYQDGILLSTITQNERDGMRASVEAGRNSFGDGILTLSTMRAGVPAGQEVNFNAAVAWFDFAAGWQGAHVNPGGTLAPGASNGVTQDMLTVEGSGQFSLDLGVNSQTDGMLFAIGNNNSNIVVQTSIKNDGTGWNLRVQNNAMALGSFGLDRDFSFLYLPYDTRGLVGGVYDGNADAHLSSVGEFTMTRLATGEYELVIPGETPETGMLILTVAHETTSGSNTGPDDNLLSYEATANGSFLIHSVDLPGVSLEDTGFAWAFISFENPILPIPEPATMSLLFMTLPLAAPVLRRLRR